jgi:hypothetical protein
MMMECKRSHVGSVLVQSHQIVTIPLSLSRERERVQYVVLLRATSTSSSLREREDYYMLKEYYPTTKRTLRSKISGGGRASISACLAVQRVSREFCSLGWSSQEAPCGAGDVRPQRLMTKK